jgi:CRISPR-associated protein Cas1
MQLYINTYGTSMRIIDGLLSLKHEKDLRQIPLGKIKTIFITKSIQLSSDVLYQCIENGIDLVITERNGHPVGRLWNNRFGSISTIRKSQLEFANSQSVIPWVIENMREKMLNQKELLLCFLANHEPDKSLIDQSVVRLESLRERIYDYVSLPHDEAGGKIRAIEGQAAKVYFNCINEHLPHQFQFTKRSKRPALDMINAMLNYAYGTLYALLEQGLIKAGLDPFIGFFHRDEYNRPVLTYDVIEPFRPWVDWVVINLCCNEVFDETFFTIEDGGYWMAGDGKRILIQHLADVMDDIIDYDGEHHSRKVHIDRRAQNIASMIQNSFKS